MAPRLGRTQPLQHLDPELRPDVAEPTIEVPLVLAPGPLAGQPTTAPDDANDLGKAAHHGDRDPPVTRLREDLVHLRKPEVREIAPEADARSEDRPRIDERLSTDRRVAAEHDVRRVVLAEERRLYCVHVSRIQEARVAGAILGEAFTQGLRRVLARVLRAERRHVFRSPARRALYET